MNSLYSSSPCPPFSHNFSFESQNPHHIFSQASVRDISKSRVPNELFYAPQKKIKLEGRFVTLPQSNPETTLCPHQRQSLLEEELNTQNPFEISVQTSNLSVSSVNQRSKEPIENQLTLNSHMNFLPTNSFNFQNNQLNFNLACPPVDLSDLYGLPNQADHTSNVFSLQNSLVSNISTNCFNASYTALKKPSLPGLSNDDPIWEYLGKEQEDFKQFVQKIKEIVAVCTNPTESLEENESSEGELDLFDDFGSDSDDEVFFPRETSRLRKTPGSKNSKKKASDKKESKKNSKESANKEKKIKKAKRSQRGL